MENKQADSDLTRPFRLLSLSGGGVRGLFQARFLQRLEEVNSAPIASMFDGIAATSTGAIVGLALAARRPAANIARIFVEASPTIFRKRPFAALRRGSRYDSAELENRLEEELGDIRIGDLDIDVFVATCVTDTYEGNVFTRADRAARLVDVALASAGAPTYFPPRRVSTDARAHVDGGLWANNPSLAAIQQLMRSRKLGTADISVLSLGTGRVQRGQDFTSVLAMRTLSVDTLQFLFDIVSSLQEWHVGESLEQMLGREQYLHINPILAQWIPLDDYRSANRVLPGIADSEFDRFREQIGLLQQYDGPSSSERAKKRVSDTVIAGAAAASLKTFIPARKYYKEFRDGRESITSYIEQATSDLVIVGINLMTGDALESIFDRFHSMLMRPQRAVGITLSLLDPEEDHLMRSVSSNLNMSAHGLARQINELIERTIAFADGLNIEARRRFHLTCHGTIPSASAIMIDVHDAHGTIQLETKAYKTPTIEAFGFEVRHGSELFDSLRRGYLRLIADGREIL